jgi:hypothetical protein
MAGGCLWSNISRATFCGRLYLQRKNYWYDLPFNVKNDHLDFDATSYLNVYENDLSNAFRSGAHCYYYSAD